MPEMVCSKKGFTLIEVVVAMVVLSTVAVALLRVGISARQATPVQMDRAGAENIARMKLESLYESVRQDQWNVADQPLSVGTSQGSPQNVVVNGKTYILSYTVSSVNLSGDGGGQDYRKVDVLVQ